MELFKKTLGSVGVLAAVVGLYSAPHAVKKWQLQQYHQAEGAQTFSDTCVERYIAQAGTTAFVEEMLAIKDSQGSTVFENMPLCQYYLDHGSVSYAQTLATYATADGKPLFDHSDILIFNSDHIPLDYIEGLLGIQDQNGNRVIDKRRDINDYYDASISLDQLRELFSIQKKDGSPVFDSISALSYIRMGGTTSLAQQATAVTNPSGSQFLSSYDIKYIFYHNIHSSKEEQISFDEIQELAQITRDNQNSLFTGNDYVYFKKNGGTLEDAIALASIHHRNGIPTFSDANAITSYNMTHGTYAYAQEAAAISDSNGNPIFNEEAIIDLSNSHVQLTPSLVKKARELHTLSDGHGSSLFQGRGLISYLTTDDTISYAQKLAALQNPDMVPLFTGEDIALYAQAYGSLPYAQALAALRDEKGYALFDGKSIRKAWEEKVDSHYAQEVASLQKELPLDGLRITRYWQLEMTLEDLSFFEDTQKLNALVIYPTADHENFLTSPAFELDNQLQFFYELRKYYDVFVRIAAQEQEVYDALLAMPAVDLFYVGGHGTPTTLSLGEKDLAIEKRTKSETYTIDVGDTELSYYLSTLEPDAIIVESSCENAKEIPNGQNLAQFIEEMSTERDTHRTILAAKDSLNAHDSEVISWVPFSIQFYGGDFPYQTNVTYSSQ